MPESESGYANRKIKDCVFSALFGDKEYLLQMYQTLHPEDTDVSENDLDIVTIQNILVNDLYNDLGFTVRDQLVILAEAQSTWTTNILYRVLLYFAKTIQEYITAGNIDLYTTKQAIIPKPEFYVIYTGDRKDKPEYLSLSDNFYFGEDLFMDIRVKMLYGDENSTDIISQYVTFSKVYNDQRKSYGPTEEAVTETIRICKDKNILKKFLESREREVIDMYTTLFNEEQIMKAHDATVFKAGEARGEARGEAKGEARGMAKGENRIVSLINKLIDIGRDKEISKVTTDVVYRNKLMAEFGI